MSDQAPESGSYPWGRSRPFNDYSGFCRDLFSERVQKLSVDAGFTCPNRDGTKGRGGCSFCDNKTFNPLYCLPEKSITDQLDQGISFFRNRYPGQKYLAYFQAYSNTYDELDVLRQRYEEALEHPSVVGLVIGTRPDCIYPELVDYLDGLAGQYFVSLEFGVESPIERTLLRVNRGHTFTEVEEAFEMCQSARFYTGMHLILGLPGESREEILQHPAQINRLPFNFLKLHQMQIISGTRLQQEFAERRHDFIEFSVDEYIELVIQFIEQLRPDIVMERFISESPRERLISPRWGLKNHAFVTRLEQRMNSLATFQGRLYT